VLEPPRPQERQDSLEGIGVQQVCGRVNRQGAGTPNRIPCASSPLSGLSARPLRAPIILVRTFVCARSARADNPDPGQGSERPRSRHQAGHPGRGQERRHLALKLPTQEPLQAGQCLSDLDLVRIVGAVASGACQSDAPGSRAPEVAAPTIRTKTREDRGSGLGVPATWRFQSDPLLMAHAGR
jgi:hypothetical protein